MKELTGLGNQGDGVYLKLAAAINSCGHTVMEKSQSEAVRMLLVTNARKQVQMCKESAYLSPGVLEEFMLEELP
ncbi:hypothetical protein STEG23_003168 [Scotinomys teguina]